MPAVSSAHRQKLSWLAVLIWTVIIFVLSAQPSIGSNLGAWDFFLRKSAHVGEYAVLFFLIWNALKQRGKRPGLTIAIAGIAAFLYACSDEFHQHFVSGRQGTPRDVAIDFIGIVVTGLIIFRLWPKKTSRAEARGR